MIYQFLHFIGVDPITEAAWWIATLLFIQVALIATLIIMVTLQRLWRQFSRRNNRERAAQFREWIVDAIESDDEKSFFTKKQSKQERGFLRRILIGQFQAELDSKLKSKLQELYMRLGYWADDKDSLKSFFWSTRLRALIRLYRMGLAVGPEVLKVAMEDKEDLVALAALRALSRSEGQDAVLLLDELSRRAPSRRDLFEEIMADLCTSDPKRFLVYLKECYDPFLVSIGIGLLARLKFEEAKNWIFQLTESASDDVAKAALESIGAFWDLEVESLLIQTLQHPQPHFRASALRGMIRSGRARWTHQIESLLKDSSVEVRRLAFELEGGRRDV